MAALLASLAGEPELGTWATSLDINAWCERRTHAQQRITIHGGGFDAASLITLGILSISLIKSCCREVQLNCTWVKTQP